ncbi:hypothetical protein ABID81_002544 [Frigoribacterium sp. PvP054]|uniref:hypothetical protein n=1 Tax=Frigoribacterium sp. PvP054 TaxID=3156438 RepID=UPI003398CD68
MHSKLDIYFLIVHIYAALFALVLIALAVVGPFLAVRDGEAWVIPFLLACGVLGVMLLRLLIGAYRDAWRHRRDPAAYVED